MNEKFKGPLQTEGIWLQKENCSQNSKRNVKIGREKRRAKIKKEGLCGVALSPVRKRQNWKNRVGSMDDPVILLVQVLCATWGPGRWICRRPGKWNLFTYSTNA